jgi:hypothetical protein
MGWQAALGIIGIGTSLFSGYKSSSALKSSSKAAREAAYANAEDLRALAESNSGAYREAGAYNANSIRYVGEANALAVENATTRNMFLYGMQADEDRRRHILQQKLTAGTIRAMVGASGVQTNTGSPLHYLNSQIDLGIRERRYGDLKAYWTLRTMFEEGEERASVIRLTADQQADVTEYNANLQAEMSYAEAMRQATAMERSGDVTMATGNAQASAAMWGGLSNALGAFSTAYNAGWFNFGTGGSGAYATQTSAFNQSASWASSPGWYIGGGINSRPYSSAYGNY